MERYENLHYGLGKLQRHFYGYSSCFERNLSEGPCRDFVGSHRLRQNEGNETALPDLFRRLQAVTCR